MGGIQDTGLEAIASVMRRPAWLFDARAIADAGAAVSWIESLAGRRG